MNRLCALVVVFVVELAGSVAGSLLHRVLGTPPDDDEREDERR